MISRLLILALALIPVANLLAIEDAKSSPLITALSTNGICRLRLLDVSRTSRDELALERMLRFKLEFPQIVDGKTIYSSSRPSDTFLENENPLVAASFADGHEIPSTHFTGWTDHNTSHLTCLLPLGDVTRLQRLELAVTLVRVNGWDEHTFAGLQMGDSGYLPCGPFELRGKGVPKGFSLTAGAYSDFDDMHRNYQLHMPLKFITHIYAIEQAEIIDALNRKLFLSSVWGMGGSSTGLFDIPAQSTLAKTSDESEKPAAAASPKFKPALEVSYPITVKLKLPKRYKKVLLKFHFEELNLPQIPPGAMSSTSSDAAWAAELKAALQPPTASPPP